jgi:drug/metabolite transporter (DMT)-like permease
MIFLLITVVLFSTFEVTGKLLSGLHPLQITLYRFLIGGIFLLPFAIKKIIAEKVRITFKMSADFALLGFINIVVSMGFIQYGVAMTNASTAAAIFSANPVIVAVFASVILKEKITFQKIAGIFFGVFGVAILFYDKFDLAGMSWQGPLYVVIAAVFFALYTVLGKKASAESGSLIMNAFSFLIGSVMLVPLMLVMKVPLVSMTPALVPGILYMGIVVSGLAYLFYFIGLENVDASTGSLVYFLKPVMASVFSVIILHEVLKPAFFIGTAVVLLGIGAVNAGSLMNRKKIGDRSSEGNGK